MIELLTVREHARALGLDDRKLRRMLLSAERRHGRPIGARTGTRWVLTEAELRRYLPSLYGEGGLDALERQVRDHMRSVDARIDRRSEAVAVRVVADERRAREAGDVRVAGLVAEVACGFEALAVRVAALESVSEEVTSKNTNDARNTLNGADAAAKNVAV